MLLLICQKLCVCVYVTEEAEVVSVFIAQTGATLLDSVTMV